MKITRRHFLKLIAASAIGVTIPAFSKTRDPYVANAEVVNYVGHNNGFIGGQLVKEVGKWDGIGYPVKTLTNGFPGSIETYYDFDLADFNREIPKKFWDNPTNHKRYNNIHSFLREQRFGETVEQAVQKLSGIGSQE